MDQTLNELLQRHIAAENAHDLEGTLATLHADCVFRDHATGQVWRGREGAAEHYRQWWKSLDVTVSRSAGQSASWISDRLYIAEATWTGPHVGDFLGIAASGRIVKQPFVVIVTFKDGLMAGESFYYDLASLLRQLGADKIPEVQQLPYRAAA